MDDIRISLQSSEWHATEKMSAAHKLLQDLLNNPNPSAETVEQFIAEFDWANYVEREYYFAVPYLVDFLLQHFDSVRAALMQFSHTLMTPDRIPEDAQQQIRGCRHRIAELMLCALESDSARSELDYKTDCFQYIATIAAVYMEPYVGNLIDRVADEL